MAEITLTVQVSIPVSLTHDVKLPDLTLARPSLAVPISEHNAAISDIASDRASM
jgi:hypothetical protein